MASPGRAGRSGGARPERRNLIASRLLYPPRTTEFGGAIKLVHHYAYEESGIRLDWIDAFNRDLDGMSCVSRHVRKIMIDHGLILPMAVTGNGVDHWDRIEAADGERLDPPGNGQWIYLFRPVMVRGSSFRDQKPLIDIGYLQSERLVDMSRHDYSKDRGVEPNLTFTPDGKWIIFSGNFHSPRANGRSVTHTYAVEVARAR